MTTFRKWRFPILIGSGILAAAALIYFANGRVNSDKTQGAIGKRDVYRDGKVDAASVGAVPGTAPVAMQAILDSNEFKALAKNDAFQSLLSNQGFQQMAKDGAFVRLLSDASFQQMAQSQAFQGLMRNEAFRVGLAASHVNELNKQSVRALDSHKQDLARTDSNFAALRQDANFQALRTNEAFSSLLRNSAFSQLTRNSAFVNLLSSGSFQSLMRDRAFQSLVAQASFQNALLSGSTANMSAQLLRQ
jgi:hypothetical protein